ncbi:MAG: NADH-quinone oxidoreductase subunit M [Bacteroidota bacterium]
MLLLALIILPLIAAMFCLAPDVMPVRMKALVSSLVSLGLTAYAVSLYITDPGDMLAFDTWWIKDLGISFNVGMDGISLLLVILTNVLVPLIILSSFGSDYDRPRTFYALVLLMQAALIGVFTSMDGFLFYIFWELALIPIYFICLMWGGSDRIRITLKFFIYTMTGSLLMLVGLIYIYLQTPGTHSFAIADLYNVSLSSGDQSWLFWFFLAAFAVKIPIFPLHTWQPDTYTEAPAQGTMLLSGIMLKMGTYGLIRWLLPLFPQALNEYGGIIMGFAITGVIYASCMALVQKDFKRLIAYSSLAHAGLIAAGIFSMNTEGIQGAMIQMLAHGVNVVGIFFIVEIIQRRMKTRSLDNLGGIAHINPVFTILFMIILLGSVALPLTNGFVGEFLLLNGIFQYSPWMAAAAGLTVILGAVYMLRSYQQIMLGEPREKNNEFTGLRVSEKVVLISIAAIIICTGIYPKPILLLTEPAVEEILSHIKQVY